MAYLIVCCDGTWNDAKNCDGGSPAPTNVRQLFNALQSIPGKQETRYQSGVGSEGIFDKILGGILGFGLSEDIRDCYQWLCDKYQDDDEILLFGFSRGAFTARSLSGMITKFGLVDFSKIQDIDREKVVKQVYKEGYREKESKEYLETEFDIPFRENSNKVLFLGVWDTVGALGIPNDKALLDLFDSPKNYEFHDVDLNHHVLHARHAVAIDEQRGSFSPTLWQGEHAQTHPDMKQLWFPGVHSDIGGGYKENDLSDCALKWMIDEVNPIATLSWDSALLDQIVPNPQGELHDSYHGVMKVLIATPRSIPDIDKDSALFHSSALRRREKPSRAQGGYRRTRQISPAQPVTIDIYAKHPWFWTGIYLNAGQTYQFTARGAWVDASIPCGPEGTKDGKFYPGELVHIIGSVTGKLESLYKDLFDKQDANFTMTKRVESSPWFCLMGAVANGGNPGIDGSACALKVFEIGKGVVFTPTRSGYLYCFANDAWGFYGNNRGYVTLTITQLD